MYRGDGKDKVQVKDFLIRHQMYYEQIDLDRCLMDYLDEMEIGLSRAGSSLPMVPAYVFVDKMKVRNKKIISIDVGGTNLRVALVSFNQNGECKVSNMQKYSMPGLKEPITSDEFFETITGYITPLLFETHQIAISFAYPTEITTSMDGKILRMVKEIKIERIEGCFLGDCLKKTLYQRTGRQYNVYVTNDTVATCLAGISNSGGAGCTSYIGLVLGTGINSCYIEKLQNIKKIIASNGKKYMLINTESGNYNRQPRGDIDVLFDNIMADPGHNTLEKMISGGYFGALIDYIIRCSKREGLFTRVFYEAFEKADPLETVDVDAFIRNQDGENKLAEVCQQNMRMIAASFIN